MQFSSQNSTFSLNLWRPRKTFSHEWPALAHHLHTICELEKRGGERDRGGMFAKSLKSWWWWLQNFQQVCVCVREREREREREWQWMQKGRVCVCVCKVGMRKNSQSQQKCPKLKPNRKLVSNLITFLRCHFHMNNTLSRMEILVVVRWYKFSSWQNFNSKHKLVFPTKVLHWTALCWSSD